MKTLQILAEQGIFLRVWIRDGKLIYVCVIYPDLIECEYLDERTVQDVEL